MERETVGWSLQRVTLHDSLKEPERTGSGDGQGGKLSDVPRGEWLAISQQGEKRGDSEDDASLSDLDSKVE